MSLTVNGNKADEDIMMQSKSNPSSVTRYQPVNLLLETRDPEHGMAEPTSPATPTKSAWLRNFCAPCIFLCKWFPVLFILAVVAWSYYAYVVQLCILTVDGAALQVVYLVLYHVFLTMFLWAYWQTVFTPIGRVPAHFKLPTAEIIAYEQADDDQRAAILERFARDLPVNNRTLGRAVRFCEKCQNVKPDRAHHCSVCGTCVLKMDHHCPWVNNCVAFTNYKYFLLFLAYALLYCIFVFATTVPYFVDFWRGTLLGNARFHVLFLFFVAVMFAISLVSLFGYHCYLVVHNRSTLESFRAPVFHMGPDKNGFSLGKYNNFVEVFGNNWKTWILPVFTTQGDGIVFPTQLHGQTLSYDAMGSP